MLRVLAELVSSKVIGACKVTKMWKKTAFWIFPNGIHDFFTHKKSEVPKEVFRISAVGISVCSALNSLIKLILYCLSL